MPKPQLKYTASPAESAYHCPACQRVTNATGDCDCPEGLYYKTNTSDTPETDAQFKEDEIEPWPIRYGRMIQHARGLERRLAEDSARLDWLEENCESLLTWLQDDPNGEPTRRLWQCENCGLERARDTARAAIDAAKSKAI